MSIKELTSGEDEYEEGEDTGKAEGADTDANDEIGGDVVGNCHYDGLVDVESF